MNRSLYVLHFTFSDGTVCADDISGCYEAHSFDYEEVSQWSGTNEER
jgi:hypothetical protein